MALSLILIMGTLALLQMGPVDQIFFSHLWVCIYDNGGGDAECHDDDDGCHNDDDYMGICKEWSEDSSVRRPDSR